MGKTKESFKDRFLQQRLAAVRLSWGTKGLLILFLVAGLAFAVLSIPLFIVANNAYEDVYIYDGYDYTDSPCHITENNQNVKCEVEFTLKQDVNGPLAVYYELDNFYQNHREYVNSVNWDQMNGEVMKGEDLEADCGSKTYVDEEKKKILVPCGYIANSFFNDKITLETEGITMNEKNIAYKGDLKRFNNPEGYGQESEEYQYIYETYPQIDRELGVKDEHFIVWMRLAGVPHFRKLYGRLEGKEFKKGDVIKFSIDSNFEVTSFKGRKALVLSTENFIGGKNYGIGICFVIAAVLSFVIDIAILIAKKYCVNVLPVNGGKYD